MSAPPDLVQATLIKLDPGAQTRVTKGPFARIVIEGDELIGEGEDEGDEELLAYKYGGPKWTDDSRVQFDRIVIERVQQ